MDIEGIIKRLTMSKGGGGLIVGQRQYVEFEVVMNDSVKEFYEEDGICIVNALSAKTFDSVRDRVVKTILGKLGASDEYDLSDYHKWWKDKGCRSRIASSAARHFHSSMWCETDLYQSVERVMQRLYPNKVLSLWDEGLGTTAYRLVRPNHNDGYPPSRKSWGPGGKLVSVTIPLIGFSLYESQGFIPGSHRVNYASYLPQDGKFCKEERRLKDWEKYSLTRYETKPGDIIVFHYDTIHSEQIIGKDVTRLALEVRYVVG